MKNTIHTFAWIVSNNVHEKSPLLCRTGDLYYPQTRPWEDWGVQAEKEEERAPSNQRTRAGQKALCVHGVQEETEELSLLWKSWRNKGADPCEGYGSQSLALPCSQHISFQGPFQLRRLMEKNSLVWIWSKEDIRWNVFCTLMMATCLKYTLACAAMYAQSGESQTMWLFLYLRMRFHLFRETNLLQTAPALSHIISVIWLPGIATALHEEQPCLDSSPCPG